MDVTIQFWLLNILYIISCCLKQSAGLHFCNGTVSRYGVSLVYNRTLGATRCSCRLRVENPIASRLNYTVRVGHVRTEVADGGGFYNLSLSSGNFTRSIINVTLPERMLILQAPQNVGSRVALDTGHLATSPRDFRLRIFSGSKRTKITVTCTTLSDDRPGHVSSTSTPAMTTLSTAVTPAVPMATAPTPTQASINRPSLSSSKPPTSPYHDTVEQSHGNVSPWTVAGLSVGTTFLSSILVLALIVYRKRKLRALSEKGCRPLPRQPIDSHNNSQCCTTGHVSYVNVKLTGLSQEDSGYYNVEPKADEQLYENIDAFGEDEYDLACSAVSPDEPCHSEMPALRAGERRPSASLVYHDNSSCNQHHQMHNIYLNVASLRRTIDQIVEQRNDSAVKSAKDTTEKSNTPSEKSNRLMENNNSANDIMNESTDSLYTLAGRSCDSSNVSSDILIESSDKSK